MKTVSLFTTAAALALTLGFVACLNSDGEEEHTEEHSLFVVVRDSLGVLVAADTVHWSLAGDSTVLHKAAHGGPGDTVRHGATRISDSGSVWKIADHLHGSFHIRAARDAADPATPGCRLVGYTVSRFHADSIADTVSLTLKNRVVCPGI
jgi:hypothetical protein